MANVTVTLRQPIEAHGETIRELELREPTGADFLACGGMPFEFGEHSTVNAKVTAAYISRLGRVPPRTVDRMSPRDIMACWTAMMPFFVDAEEEEPKS